MITIRKEIAVEPDYPLERIGRREELLFFDIETTGFSGEHSRLYLIGCVFFEASVWRLTQWFADRESAEEEMLHAFFSMLRRFRYLVHFNGDGFDLPFIRKRCAAYHLDYSFDGIESVDIYRKIRPWKRFLGLDSLKQKSVERFLGVDREDRYSGGELIEVYQEYLRTGEERLYRLLVLHNEDDLKGMPAILPILHYPDFLAGEFSFLKWEQESDGKVCACGREALSEESGSAGRIFLFFESSVSLPVPVERTAELDGVSYTLSLSENRLRLGIPLLRGELKRFYEDYQNYVYLIYEDTAVHKSVGQYVEREARRKATARTCYTRVEGLFIPQPVPLWEPCLRSGYKEKTAYALCSGDLFESERALAYLRAVLSVL